MVIENKFPGKDITPEDLISKFPLTAKKDKDHKSKFDICGVQFGSSNIPIFAGPNMVESRELIIDIAKNVKDSGASFLRGGAFKPLTFPYRSERYKETREEGIEWLVEASQKVGIPIITEVKNATKQLSNGQIVTLNLEDGSICRGNHNNNEIEYENVFR